MRITYDKTADAAYIGFSDEPYLNSKHLNEDILIEYAKNGSVRGVEILAASEYIPSLPTDKSIKVKHLSAAKK